MSTELAQQRELSFPYSDEVYQQLVERSPDAIYILVGEEITFANASMLELVGAERADDVVGHIATDFIHPAFHEEIQQRRKFVRATGKPTRSMEIKLVRLNGMEINVEYSSAPLHRDHLGIQVHLQDITQRKISEAQLLESERNFHQLADSMPQLVWTAGPDGNLEYRNQKWREKTCLADETDAETIWRGLLHPDDAERVIRTWEQSVRAGQPFQMEYRCVDPDSGAYRWHLGRALPMKDSDGKVIRWFGTCTDIHDQKLIEIELQRAQEQLAQNAVELERRIHERTLELQEIVRSTEALNYSIAHDLRAPLRAIMGFSNVLLEDYAVQLDQTGQEYARRIVNGARRMDSLICALLAYGRLNYEDLTFSFTNPNLVLENVLHDLKPQIEASHAQISIAGNFPKIWTNPTVFEKIFTELIGNALKFCSPERTPKIEIRAEELDTATRFWIRDNGIGIPKEYHERIFRIMESLHAADKYSGTGIGLAIVRRGIQRLGGQLGLESKEGEGSAFWIQFPKAFV